ncbi:MAG TPA: COX15/CtaA family protein [Anaerolineales bacterium]
MIDPSLKLTRTAKFAWAVLAFNVFVVLWGAVVRATGSGAGCGSHWPLCNGVVVPESPQITTLVEFIHRASSGTSLLLILGLFVLVFRAYPKKSPARLGASLSVFFIITEALLGAALVLFGWVAKNASIIPTASHLVNTFLLLASLALTAWWSSGGKPVRLKGQGIALWGLGLGLLGVLALGVTGAVNALGDTLFPSASLAAGIQQDFSPTAHFLIRLRVWHPVLAVSVGLYLFFVGGLLAMFRPDPLLRRIVAALGVLVVLQLSAGLVNLILLAPVWMQIVHLFLADLVWITLVLLGADALGAAEPVPEPGQVSQAAALHEAG